ncbi:MAG: hypothetical protein Q7S40_27260 [Opitutaceae bacterium]|nr:hypothetical protein [Opitutaceae bacterium]
MSQRLDELRRQRALVQEHLAWLDREIAAAAPQKSAVSTTTISPAAPAPIVTKAEPLASTSAAVSSPSVGSGASIPSVLSVPSPTSAGATAAAPPPGELAVEKLLEEYRVAPDAVRQDVRKGCFLYFAAACALFALVVVVLFFALRTR